MSNKKKPKQGEIRLEAKIISDYSPIIKINETLEVGLPKLVSLVGEKFSIEIKEVNNATRKPRSRK